MYFADSDGNLVNDNLSSVNGPTYEPIRKAAKEHVFPISVER